MHGLGVGIDGAIVGALLIWLVSILEIIREWAQSVLKMKTVRRLCCFGWKQHGGLELLVTLGVL